MPTEERARPRMAGLAVLAFAGLMAGCGASSSNSSAITATTPAATGDETTTTVGSGGTTTTETPTTEAGVDEGDRQAYVEAFTDNLSGDGSVTSFTSADVECLANGFLDTIGFDEIVARGVTPDEFGEATDFGGKLDIDDSTANDLYDQFEACDIDLKELFQEVAEGFDGKPFTVDEQACIDRSLNDDNIRTSFLAEIKGEDLADDPLDALDECLDLSLGPDGPAADTAVPPPNDN